MVNSLFPPGHRRNLGGRNLGGVVAGSMVDSTDLQNEPFLQFGEREQLSNARLLELYCPRSATGRKRRTRKQMDLPHHRSDEAFDMTAKMRLMDLNLQFLSKSGPESFCFF